LLARGHAGHAGRACLCPRVHAGQAGSAGRACPRRARGGKRKPLGARGWAAMASHPPPHFPLPAVAPL
jgi:hypothetical protein